MLPTGARIVYAEDANGAIGKLPTDSGVVWIDGATYVHAMRQAEYLATRKKRRGD